jgi:hypothetical protein
MAIEHVILRLKDEARDPSKALEYRQIAEWLQELVQKRDALEQGSLPDFDKIAHDFESYWADISGPGATEAYKKDLVRILREAYESGLAARDYAVVDEEPTTEEDK